MEQESKKITEKRLKWYGHVRRMKEEHIVRRMLDVDIPGKKKRAAKPTMARCMQERHDRDGSQEDNTTHRAALRNKIISYTGYPR